MRFSIGTHDNGSTVQPTYCDPNDSFPLTMYNDIRSPNSPHFDRWTASSSYPSQLEATIPRNNSTRITTYHKDRQDDLAHDVAHQPRPPNAFMLYRSDFLKKVRIPKEIEKKQQNLSIVAGQLWHLLPDAEKNMWKKEAQEKARRHLLRFPDYMRNPKRKAKKVKKINVKDSHEYATQLRQEFYPHVGAPEKSFERLRCKAASSRSSGDAADRTSSPPLPLTHQTSTMEQTGWHSTIESSTPTPSIRPSSLPAWPDFSTLPSPSARPPHIMPHSRLPPSETANIEATLANDAPTPLDQLTCEMNCCRIPPTTRSLSSFEDPLPDPLSLNKLAPPHPIYRESPSPISDFQSQAAVPDLPSQAIHRPSSSTHRPDWRNTSLPISNMRDDPFGSFACNYPFYGRTDGV